MYKFVSFVVVLLMFFGAQCWAVEEKITVTWDYPNPPVDLVNFGLRVNGDNATITTIEPEARMWSDMVVLNDGDNIFDMRACDGRQCSIWSEPAIYNPAPVAPSAPIVTSGELIIDASVDKDSMDVHVRWKVVQLE
jgi:hypothetical protein